MRVLEEAHTVRLVDDDLALAAAREAFLATGDGVTFPVVVGHGGRRADRFTLKSGTVGAETGVKIGSYWPGNDAGGIPRHGSAVILLDQRTGRLAAVVETAAANAYRTAAADALAVLTLARPDSRVLTVIGTGHQALHDVRAVARVGSFATVLVAGRRPEAARAFATEIRRLTGLPARAATAEAACRAADVVITATTSARPLFDADWIRPGAHVSAMGADAPGKQELPPRLYERATLFCDLAAQSRAIGELQHAPVTAPVTQLGDVLRGRAPGRVSATQITVFDSSGFALQDLTLAAALLARADQHRTEICE
ncbi:MULTISPECIES: ornithine cyclodeaminase family protein [Catenuloplanes]|uniref:Ornithine cyclodeaminase n=1 Tax=Catenuloplanes niger TaxID=587534 RepID=A0AAE3ZM05_9ACTN|nr:ornithine cyclodeaminase family protein [Catenuloplanes niger]MDR7320603.1 ornithine cyclodeaminase [Catenuloplanes niger]